MNTDPSSRFSERHPNIDRLALTAAAVLAVLVVGDLSVTAVTQGDVVMPLTQMTFETILN